jgi:hypothetical protein
MNPFLHKRKEKGQQQEIAGELSERGIHAMRNYAFGVRNRILRCDWVWEWMGGKIVLGSGFLVLGLD